MVHYLGRTLTVLFILASWASPHVTLRKNMALFLFYRDCLLLTMCDVMLIIHKKKHASAVVVAATFYKNVCDIFLKGGRFGRTKSLIFFKLQSIKKKCFFLVQ